MKKITRILLLIIILVLLFVVIKVGRDKRIERRSNQIATQNNIPIQIEKENATEVATFNNKTTANSSTNTTNQLVDGYLKPGDYRFTLMHDDIERYYLLHIPSLYNDQPTSVILALHGGMGSAEGIAQNYDLVEKSDKEGFVVAFSNGASRFPSGKRATWNAGDCCGYAVTSKSDDVGFIKKVAEDIRKKINVEKMFATGMSNGGMMVYRLACEIPEDFTAIAAVAGTDNYYDCKTKKPISVMHIHSEKDKHVLFKGGCGPNCIIRSETEHTSVADTISKWVKSNRCNKKVERIFENENAYCDLYKNCNNDTLVKLCVTKDGGHSWPGLKISSENRFEKNVSSQAISATDEIWKFFKSR